GVRSEGGQKIFHRRRLFYAAHRHQSSDPGSRAAADARSSGGGGLELSFLSKNILKQKEKYLLTILTHII
ncbi:MAG: hypothetical protein LBO05_08350, partial [Deltaproteobacteria bacterium]|nr:hypothetical protein [Deltaproteobacteria bacterium]